VAAAKGAAVKAAKTAEAMAAAVWAAVAREAAGRGGAAREAAARGVVAREGARRAASERDINGFFLATLLQRGRGLRTRLELEFELARDGDLIAQPPGRGTGFRRTARVVRAAPYTYRTCDVISQ
jgi:hypothetical protein